jgi:hypothetical protein
MEKGGQRPTEKRTPDAGDVQFFATVRKCGIDEEVLQRAFSRSAVNSWAGFAKRKIEGGGRCKVPIAAITDGTLNGTYVDPDVRSFVCYLRLVDADARFFWILELEERERLERYWSVYGGRPSELLGRGVRSTMDCPGTV